MNASRISSSAILLLKTAAVFLFLGLFLGQIPSPVHTAVATQDYGLKSAMVRAATYVPPLLQENIDYQAILSPEQFSWHLNRVDAEKTFSNMGASSLALSPSGYPHIAYGQDHLYYAWHDGGNWHLETVDSSWGVGLYTSLALDSSERAHISYYDATNKDLKYAYYNGSSWQVDTVDNNGEVGLYSSLVLDTSDRPHISYYDLTNQDLKYAYFDGSVWQIETVDSTDDVGQHSALVLGASGKPHICYVEKIGYTYALKYTYYDGSLWQFETVGTSIVAYPSLTLDSAGWPHISYLGDDNLQYAYFDGIAWQVETVDDLYDNVGLSTSLKLDALDHPHISYQYRKLPAKYSPGDIAELKYAYYDGTSWQIEIVDSSGYPGSYSSLDIDTSGRPHISYFDAFINALKYAQIDNSTWQIETVDHATDMGQYSSLALDSAGNPHISYFDRGNRCLKYAYFNGLAWQIEIIDNSLFETQSVSLALDSSDRPHISYHYKDQLYVYGSVKYAHFDGSNWQIETVGPEPANETSIAIDSADRPHISYVKPNSVIGYVPGALMYAYFDGSSWQTTEVASDNIVSVALALDSADRPHISYRHLALKYAYYDGITWHFEIVEYDGVNPSLALDSSGRPHIGYVGNNDIRHAHFDGSSWQIQTVGYIGWKGNPSLALDGFDRPHISYYDDRISNDIRLMHAIFNGIGWQFGTVDRVGDVGSYSSLAVDSSSWPHISYYDATNGDLKYAAADFPPELSLNHSVGAPTSYFNCFGQGFPPDQLAAIRINYAVVGTQMTDATGALSFTVDTQNAEVGYYLVEVRVNSSASAGFTIDTNAPLWLKEGEYPIYISSPTSLKLTYLPVINK